jgi:hypothetical protein
MIILKNSVFSHIQKTGGTWLKSILSDYESEPAPYETCIWVLPTDRNKFTFVRNPWDWYLSYYNFTIYGSDKLPPSLRHITKFFMIKNDKIISFEEFITILCLTDKNTKVEIYNRFLNKQIDIKLYNKTMYNWLHSNKSLYTILVEQHTANCTKVGKLENIRTDIKDMLLSTNELNDDLIEKIDNVDNINITKYPKVKEVYTKEMIEIVAISETSMITEFDYKFEIIQ